MLNLINLETIDHCDVVPLIHTGVNRHDFYRKSLLSYEQFFPLKISYLDGFYFPGKQTRNYKICLR